MTSTSSLRYSTSCILPCIATASFTPRIRSTSFKSRSLKLPKQRRNWLIRYQNRVQHFQVSPLRMMRHRSYQILDLSHSSQSSKLQKSKYTPCIKIGGCESCGGHEGNSLEATVTECFLYRSECIMDIQISNYYGNSS